MHAVFLQSIRCKITTCFAAGNAMAVYPDSHVGTDEVNLIYAQRTRGCEKPALGAGNILMDYYKRSISIDWKAPGDPVTAADREASELIVSGVTREFPDHGVLCEEEPDDLSRLQRAHVWMIDPMDGTREFIEHRDEFAVQIGLVVDRTPVLGVVYQPTAGKLYYAARGLGAFLDSGGSG